MLPGNKGSRCYNTILISQQYFLVINSYSKFVVGKGSVWIKIRYSREGKCTFPFCKMSRHYRKNLEKNQYRYLEGFKGFGLDCIAGKIVRCVQRNYNVECKGRVWIKIRYSREGKCTFPFCKMSRHLKYPCHLPASTRA
jgi:hypothetical protein